MQKTVLLKGDRRFFASETLPISSLQERLHSLPYKIVPLFLRGLYRRFGVSSYKNIRLEHYEKVFQFLEDWRKSAETRAEPG